MTEALRRWLSFGLLLLLLFCGTPFSRAEIANRTAAFGLSATFICDEQATIAYDGRSLSAFDYDPVVVPTADRDATSTAAVSRIIGRSAEFFAAETTATQLEFPFASGASIQTPGVTTAGETFVRVGAGPQNLKFRRHRSVGRNREPMLSRRRRLMLWTRPGSAKESRRPAWCSARYYRILQPPAGTPIQRGIVPGGQFGGVGGAQEVIFPKGF